jgi:hypothetical protein
MKQSDLPNTIWVVRYPKQASKYDKPLPQKIYDSEFRPIAFLSKEDAIKCGWPEKLGGYYIRKENT